MGGAPRPDPGPQNIDYDGGKIHRLFADGTVPDDNPILPGKKKPTSIWSYGHRDPQGLFFDPITRTLYSNEHGPVGGDELNIIKKGKNYGWPMFSFGLNHDGTKVSNLTVEDAESFSVLPFKHWGPEFRASPSGLIKLENSNFTKWNGSFLMGSLWTQHLLRYDPKTEETDLVLKNIGRVRDVGQLPSGNFLILIDKNSPNRSYDGRILKLAFEK